MNTTQTKKMSPEGMQAGRELSGAIESLLAESARGVSDSEWFSLCLSALTYQTSLLFAAHARATSIEQARFHYNLIMACSWELVMKLIKIKQGDQNDENS